MRLTMEGSSDGNVGTGGEESQEKNVDKWS